VSLQRLERRQVVQGDLGEVFRFFESPDNLELITPRWLNFQVLESSHDRVRAGTEISYRLKWYGLPISWRSRISEYALNERFVDEMIGGPYKTWYHTHLFREVPDGVEIQDIVEYELPLGLLGDAVHSTVVGRQLAAIFDYRVRTIRTTFGGSQSEGVGEAHPPGTLE
jgi:ligand-binding SRPBCC domain-containing protein